jgi:hypothetical protein
LPATADTSIIVIPFVTVLFTGFRGVADSWFARGDES